MENQQVLTPLIMFKHGSGQGCCDIFKRSKRLKKRRGEKIAFSSFCDIKLHGCGFMSGNNSRREK